MKNFKAKFIVSAVLLLAIVSNSFAQTKQIVDKKQMAAVVRRAEERFGHGAGTPG